MLDLPLHPVCTFIDNTSPQPHSSHIQYICNPSYLFVGGKNDTVRGIEVTVRIYLCGLNYFLSSFSL